MNCASLSSHIQCLVVGAHVLTQGLGCFLPGRKENGDTEQSAGSSCSRGSVPIVEGSLSLGDTGCLVWMEPMHCQHGLYSEQSHQSLSGPAGSLWLSQESLNVKVKLEGPQR